MALMNSTLNATMRGVVFGGVPYDVTVENLPVPTISSQTDAIVRITTAGICGSDLHTYRGLIGGGAVPFTMGHEAIGYVAEVGSAVSSLSVGDYVVIPDTPSTATLEMEPTLYEFFGSGGSLDGLQAEYARVRSADANLIPVPLTRNTTSPSLEQDYLTVGDIFSTAWTAVTWSGFQPGDSVAVFGAGPVGLLAAYSALLRGASRVYSVDHVPQRLELARSIGAVPIDFRASDPVAQILAREPGGVARSVDAVGMESLNADLEIEEDILLRQTVGVTRTGGGVGVVGVYVATPDSPSGPRGSTISPNGTLPMTEFFFKGLSVRGGLVDPKLVAPELVQLIASGRARPSFITSAVIGIEDAPEYYRRFNRQEESKVFIRFP
ncbi:putative Alcohol dehydrogenase [Colletotrichum higginsianum IMI 349063]|nr:putative Alcohol dehydrogenase [Colletotrichum higginsianum IMI 349063]OBR03362.1 putative Alcohol dehydrogenase [Colletotrichum higginsianum IMI 349063]